MIRRFITRYSFNYPRSLVYMLQSSEYVITDYLNWYRRVSDFNKVEKRKHLKQTPKAIFFLIIGWVIIFLIFAFSVALFLMSEEKKLFQILAIVLIILTPYLLAYLIVIPTVLFKIFIEKPVIFFKKREIVRILKNHKAVKIAIAGSFGKTSIREILKTILSEGLSVGAPQDSYNTILGISSFVKTLSGKEDVLIFELGEYYQGDIKELSEIIKPNIGIITGVNQAHLSKFKDINKTIETIYELDDYINGQGDLYVNGENTLVNKNIKKDYLVYSKKGVGNVLTKDVKSDLSGTSFVLSINNKDFHVKSELLGVHNVGPITASVHIGLKLGLSAESLATGASKTKPFKHRLEKISDRDGVITLDDSYNGNPDGVKAAIGFLASLSGHRRFYVTPGLVEMGKDSEIIHKDIGLQLALSGIERVVLVKNSVTPYIEKGLKEGNFSGDLIWFDDAQTLFSSLPSLTVSGDVVLLQNDWPDQYE